MEVWQTSVNFGISMALSKAGCCFASAFLISSPILVIFSSHTVLQGITACLGIGLCWGWLFSHWDYLRCGTQDSPKFSGKLSFQRYVCMEEISIWCPERSSAPVEWAVRTGRAWTSVPLPTAWAQLLLVVVRLKYSSLSPSNPLFVFFLENWLPVSNCIWYFLRHFHLLSVPDWGWFTHTLFSMSQGPR